MHKDANEQSSKKKQTHRDTPRSKHCEPNILRTTLYHSSKKQRFLDIWHWQPQGTAEKHDNKETWPHSAPGIQRHSGKNSSIVPRLQHFGYVYMRHKANASPIKSNVQRSPQPAKAAVVSGRERPPIHLALAHVQRRCAVGPRQTRDAGVAI